MQNRPAVFSLHGSLETNDLKSDFSRHNRLQINNFLKQGADDCLFDSLQQRKDWRHVINGEKQIFETDAEQLAAMPQADRAVLDQAIFAAATDGFQFRYDTIRVADDAVQRVASGTLLDQFALFMNTQAVLDLFRKISGQQEICFADAQATRYRPGDFLTRHDDNVPGKDRALAYVLGLSRGWKAEWGGLLLFNDGKDGISETVVPRFNTLTVFTVGQPHSVSYVTPYAGAPRLSITGWLRTSMPN